MKIVEPTDGWGTRNGKPVAPRRWQAEELPKILGHYRKTNPSRGLCAAITGSGKSILIAQICACLKPERDEVVVVSTSRQKLVRQISQTIKDRVEGDEFMAPEVVGTYYADFKRPELPIVVACNDSLDGLATALQNMGKKCGMWLVDEAHHSQSPRLLSAYEKLAPEKVIGFTATPYRSKENDGLSTFDEVISRYTLEQALADGKVIVEWSAHNWEGPECDRDFACLSMMRELCTDRVVCNADCIADAEAFAEYCNSRGWSAKAVHSKQSSAENDRIMEELRTKQIKLVVYPDLIAEGCDYPWIKAMVLRRVVGSRTRFVQEIGRGLRYFYDEETGEEKTHLILIDVHDLLSNHKLTHKEVLSGDFDPEDVDEAESEGSKLDRTLQQQCFDVMRALTAFKIKAGSEPFNAGPLNSYLSMLVSVFDTFGLIQKKITARDWRRQPCTGKQVEAVDKMKWTLTKKQIPQLHRTALDALTQHTGKLNRGAVADLFDVQVSLANKKTWPNFAQLDQVARQGLEKHEKKKLGGASAAPISSAPRKPGLSAAAQPKVQVVQNLLFEDMGLKGKK